MNPYHVRHLLSSLTPPVLSHHLAHTFIETGTNTGHGVQTAIDCGFYRVYSIEYDRHLYDHAARRFIGDPEIHIHYGDSPHVLRRVLSELCAESPHPSITYFLDAHSIERNPLLDELAAIQNSGLRGNVILIDDVRMFGTDDWHGLTQDEALHALALIEPFTISYANTPNDENDLLIATPTTPPRPQP